MPDPYPELVPEPQPDLLMAELLELEEEVKELEP